MMRFRLNNTLHAASIANADDVLTMKGALQSLGEYETPTYGMTPYPDKQMFDGMKRVQKKNGLTADGMARPGGPTETTLNASLAKKEMEKRNAIRPAAPARQTAPHTTGKFGIGDAVKRVGKHQNQEAQPPQPTAPAASQALQLRAGVGRNQANQSKDVIALKNALSWTGHYPLEKAHRADPNVDEDLTWGISGFQRDFGLKQDGYSRPGGETEARLNQLITPLVQLATKDSFENDDKNGGEGGNVAEGKKPDCAELRRRLGIAQRQLERRQEVHQKNIDRLNKTRNGLKQAEEKYEQLIANLDERAKKVVRSCIRRMRNPTAIRNCLIAKGVYAAGEIGWAYKDVSVLRASVSQLESAASIYAEKIVNLLFRIDELEEALKAC